MTALSLYKYDLCLMKDMGEEVRVLFWGDLDSRFVLHVRGSMKKVSCQVKVNLELACVAFVATMLVFRLRCMKSLSYFY